MHAAVGERGLLGLDDENSRRLWRGACGPSEPSFMLWIERITYNDFL